MKKLYKSQNRIWNLKLEKAKNMKSKQLLIVQYMANKQMTECQASTTSFHEKAIQKKKTPGSLHQ